MKPKMTPEQREALEDEHGGPIHVGADGVLMSTDVYLFMMGLDSAAELNKSLAALQEGMNEVREGKTRPFRDLLDDLAHG